MDVRREDLVTNISKAESRLIDAKDALAKYDNDNKCPMRFFSGNSGPFYSNDKNVTYIVAIDERNWYLFYSNGKIRRGTKHMYTIGDAEKYLQEKQWVEIIPS